MRMFNTRIWRAGRSLSCAVSSLSSWPTSMNIATKCCTMVWPSFSIGVRMPLVSWPAIITSYTSAKTTAWSEMCSNKTTCWAWWARWALVTVDTQLLDHPVVLRHSLSTQTLPMVLLLHTTATWPIPMSSLTNCQTPTFATLTLIQCVFDMFLSYFYLVMSYYY